MVKAKSAYSGARSAVAAARIKHPAVTNVSMFSMSSFDADKDLPIVYCGNYNIQMFGLELFHQFDTKKYRKLARYLDYEFIDTRYSRKSSPGNQIEAEAMMPRRLHFLKPNRPISMAELKMHHSARYLEEIHDDKSKLARITELWFLNLVPWCLLEPRLLTPIKWQVSGTIFAAHLAMQHGWAINLGGGFHHARQSAGDNFCFFSDVFIAIKYIWRHHPLQKFMIIDLDAHQATGLEHDLRQLATKKRSMVYLVDVFNNSIQQTDTQADEAINMRIELGRFTGDASYLRKLDDALDTAFANFKPNMVIYIAGQDVLKHDQEGLMNVSEHGLIKRDELVFRHTVAVNKCPILMLLGGGYLARGVKLFAESVRHLYSSELIWGGHRPGSRELTRPRQEPAEQSAAAVSSPGSDRSLQPLPSALANELAGATRQTVTKSRTNGSPGRAEQQDQSKKAAPIRLGAANKLTKAVPPFSKLSRTKRSVTTSGGNAPAEASTVPVNAVSMSMSASDGGRRPAKVTRLVKTDETASKAYGGVPERAKTVSKSSAKGSVGQKVAKKGAPGGNTGIMPTESMFSDTINDP